MRSVARSMLSSFVLLLPCALGADDGDLGARYYDRWLAEVELLVTPIESSLFRQLETDREREVFIHHFWRARAGTAGNQERLEWAANVALARRELGRLDDDRARLVLLHGPPSYVVGFERDDDTTEPCGVLRPLQVLYYSAAAGRERFYAVFTPSFAGSPRYRRWRPAEGLEPLLAWRRSSLHEGLLRQPFESASTRALDLVEEGGCFRDRPSLRGVLEAALRDHASPGASSPDLTQSRFPETDDDWVERFRRELATGRIVFEAGGARPLDLELSHLASWPASWPETLLDVELRLADGARAAWPAARDGYASVTATIEALVDGREQGPVRDLAQHFWVPLDGAAAGAYPPLHVITSLPPGEYRLVVRLYAGEEIPLRSVARVMVPEPDPVAASRRAPAAIPSLPASQPLPDSVTLAAGPDRLRVVLRALHPQPALAEEVLALADVEVPAGGKVERLDFFLGDQELGSLRHPPWIWRFRLTAAQPSVLRAQATLIDGRSAEDAIVAGNSGAAIAERVDVRVVELYLTAQSRRGRPVPDLRATDLAVLENGEPQVVLELEPAGGLPISVAVMADGSSTMREEVDLERAAALRFFESVVRDGDRAAFLLFNHQLELVVPFTGDLAWLRDGTALLRAGGGTSVWDSLIYALRYVAGWTGRRAIVLVSDGHDESSRWAFDQVHELARQAGVPIYPIYLDLYRPDPSGLSDPRRKQRDAAASRLRTLARESGGDFNAAQSWPDLVSAFARIARSLRAQYRIAYRSAPAPAADAGARPTIEVRALRPGVTLRTQTGAIAPSLRSDRRRSGFRARAD